MYDINCNIFTYIKKYFKKIIKASHQTAGLEIRNLCTQLLNVETFLLNVDLHMPSFPLPAVAVKRPPKWVTVSKIATKHVLQFRACDGPTHFCPPNSMTGRPPL